MRVPLAAPVVSMFLQPVAAEPLRSNTMLLKASPGILRLRLSSVEVLLTGYLKYENFISGSRECVVERKLYRSRPLRESTT